MKTLIIHHDDCLRHDPGPRHAERPERVGAVLKAVGGLPGTESLPAPKADGEQLQRVHPADYWERLCALEPEPNPAVGPASERIARDPDTWLSAGSLRRCAAAAPPVSRSTRSSRGGRATPSA